MQKAAGYVCVILKGILFIGISIQTILGIVWMCCNFANIPSFGDSLFYFQVSETLKCDEYTGILYPLILRLTGAHQSIVYLLQLAAACGAADRFLRSFGRMKKGWRIWGCLGLLTMPVVMQCHMALLPCSFVSSLMLLALTWLIEAVKTRERRSLKRLAMVCLCWLAEALLLPEYLFLGAVPVLLYWLCFLSRWKAAGRGAVYGLLLTAAFLGMILGINSLTQREGLYGKGDRTLLKTLVQRISWTNLLEDYEDWPWQMILYANEYTIRDAAMSADGMERLLFPAIEQAAVEQPEAGILPEEYYKTMIDTAWRWHKIVILREIAWDMLSYGASPLFLQESLKGEGYDSYNGRNYEVFLEYTPELSKRYMDLGSWWFGLMLPVSAVLQLLSLPYSTILEKKRTFHWLACCLITIAAMIGWYTMRGAGMMDYKNTAVISLLWMAWAIVLSGRCRPMTPETAQQKERAPDGGRPV